MTPGERLHLALTDRFGGFHGSAPMSPEEETERLIHDLCHVVHAGRWDLLSIPHKGSMGLLESLVDGICEDHRLTKGTPALLRMEEEVAAAELAVYERLGLETPMAILLNIQAHAFSCTPAAFRDGMEKTRSEAAGFIEGLAFAVVAILEALLLDRFREEGA
jgi:hypothetical protein